MSPLGKLEFTLPSIPHDPSNEKNETGIILLNTTFSNETSSLIKIARYVIIIASYLLPIATGAQAINMTAVQKGLYNASTFSDLNETGFKTKTISREIEKIKNAFTKWSDDEGAKEALAREVSSSGIAIVQSFDDLVWAGQALGMGSGALATTLHAVSFGGTAFTMIKSYLELSQSIDAAKNDPEQQRTVRIKKAKFILATAAAGFGLSTLFFKATILSVLWALFSCATATLSAAEFFYETQKNGGKEVVNDFARPKFVLAP